MTTNQKQILSIIAAVVIVAAGYVWATKYRAEDKGVERVEGEEGEGAVAEWKTYRNEEYGFEMKYPKEWKIDTVRSSKSDVVFNRETGGEERESISVRELAEGESLQAWAAKFDDSIMVGVSELSLGGEPAMRVDTKEFGLTDIGVIHGDKFYTITTGGVMLQNGMLSTFKFTK